MNLAFLVSKGVGGGLAFFLFFGMFCWMKERKEGSKNFCIYIPVPDSFSAGALKRTESLAAVRAL